ncbi:dexamethasone-induced protein isoform X2 [Mastomys coucha]|uniref:dexamethasone-induced protein isoform X2 n=1 Tax=Mastomys coucha TaxID=35658 RepID=UPI001261DB76|nr:dexamethasone-induced protein isoform X2 [Mastomys coucha]
MPLPLVGNTIWTGMGPQEEAHQETQTEASGGWSESQQEQWGVMKICPVERTKNWTSLHGNWTMNINHCYRQACLCQQLGSYPNPGICQEK